MISFVDVGIGIGSEEVPRMFGEACWDRLQGGEGLKLGLFISSSIIKCHGGVVAVSSEGVGRGTRFYVTLACYVDASSGDNDDDDDGGGGGGHGEVSTAREESK